MLHSRFAVTVAVIATAFSSISQAALAQGSPSKNGKNARSTESATQSADVSPDYIIGPGDVLVINFWRRNDVSSEVTVRPDGKISLMLLDDVVAGGLTPEQLRDRVEQKASSLFEDARATIVVKEIHSKNVFITGLVAKPGTYALRQPTSVLQLIAMAGGLLEFADANRIAIMRTENGKKVGYKFNYDEVSNLKKLEQDIELKPGDMIVVP